MYNQSEPIPSQFTQYQSLMTLFYLEVLLGKHIELISHLEKRQPKHNITPKIHELIFAPLEDIRKNSKIKEMLLNYL